MPGPLPILMEKSIQIAWDYLERSGELGEPETASRLLLDSVELMVRHGERRQLILSNRAIDAYKRFRMQRGAFRWSRGVIGSAGRAGNELENDENFRRRSSRGDRTGSRLRRHRRKKSGQLQLQPGT